MACTFIPSVNNAKDLVNSKWSQIEALASSSVAAAEAALATIAGTTASAIANAGSGIDFSVRPAPGVNVSYQEPPQPTLPDLTAVIGDPPPNTPFTAPVYTAPDRPENFAIVAPSATGAIGWNPPQPPLNFVDQYTNPAVGAFVAPTPPTPFTNPYTPIQVGFVPPTAPADFNFSPPGIPVRSEPTLAATAPGDAPQVSLPEYPPVPTLTMPTDPAQIGIPLPTIRVPDLSGIDALLAALLAGRPTEPTLTLPTDDVLAVFNGLRTTLGTELTDSLQVESVLTWMLAGNTIGIPANIAQMLRDRAFSAEDALSFQAESEVHVDWLSRGFTLPGGAMEFRLAGIKQQNRDKKADLNRSLWIEEAKLEIENLRFAIQQGITYQGLVWDTKTKLWSICGDLASKFIDVQINVLRATLEAYKAQIDAWQAEAAVYRDYINALLQSELSKLEITKSEVEVAKLFVDLNRQGVDLYTAKLEGVAAEVALYRAQIDATNARIQGETLKLEAFAKAIDIYVASVQAYEAEWRGYTAAVQSDTARVDAFKARVDAYSANVNVYGKRVDAEAARVSAEVSVGQFQLDAYKTDAQVYGFNVDAFGKLVDAEQARINAEIALAALPLEAYKARAQVHNITVDAYGKQVQAETARVQGEVEVAKLPITLYSALVQGYDSRIRAYGTEVQAAGDETRNQLEIQRLWLEKYQADNERFKSELSKASVELEAKARTHDSQVRLFATQIESAKALISSELQTIDQELRGIQYEASTKLQQAELEQTKIIELIKSALSANQEIARVSAQLAGAALSAVNASASMSDGFSSGIDRSCRENHNYEY